MRVFRVIQPLVVMMVCGLAALNGQETRGIILGRVTDQTNAVIVGAKVTAMNTVTGVTATATTTSTGDYTFPYLIPGPYTITVEAKGFKSVVRPDITVRVSDRVAINVTMEVGQAAQSIEVSARSTILDTSTASVGQVIESQTILDMPLKDGTPSMLVILSPGVLFQPGSGSPGYVRPFDTGGPSGLSIDGTRSGSNQFMVDGTPDMAGNTIAYSPPPSVVDEVKVSASTFDASYGYMGGAVLNMSLKSGGNGLHGQAYYFHQNPALNANRFFSNRTGAPKLALRIHRYGGAATGPIYVPKVYNGRNKSFFMYAYEGIWSFDPTPFTVSAVPTSAQRTGDFSGLLALGSKYQIYDPYTITPAAGGRTSRQPLAGNIIPPSRISPTAARLANLWEFANQPGTADGTNNWQRAKNAQDTYWNHIGRIDHNLSEKLRFFVRANATSMWRPENLRHNGAYGDISWRYNRGFGFDNVYVPSASFFVNTRYSLTRFMTGAIPIRTATEGMDWDLAALGFSPQFIQQVKEAKSGAFSPQFMQRIKQANSKGLALPVFQISGYANMALSGLSRSNNDIHDFQLNLTNLIGSHSLRYGTGYRVLRRTNANFGNLSGSLDFDASWTRGPLDTSPAAPMGQSLASFLYGLPSGGDFTVSDSYAEQTSIWATYLQDDWKISRKLTLSLGMRLEREWPLTERFNRSVRGFDAATASPIAGQALAKYAQNPIPEVPVGQFAVRGGLTFLGAGGLPRTPWNASNNWMPRAGVAYSLTAKTVLRAGYGLFYEPIGVTYVHVNQTGFSRTTDLVASLDNGQNFIASLTNPFPNGFVRPLGAAGGLSTNLGQGVSFFNPDLKNPYMQRWQLALQRQLPAEQVVEASYVGNRGARQRISRNMSVTPRQYLSTLPVRDQATINFLNARVPNPFYPLLPGTSLASETVARSQLLTPYPQFTGVSMDTNQGYSWYHSLQVRYEKRFSAGLRATVSYTWSKLMEAMSYLNSTDPMPERVIAAADRTHNLAVSWIYELPFGQRKQWGASVNRALSTIISGWQVQGIYTGCSGAALGFGNVIFTGNLKDIPIPNSARTVDRWFNVDAGFERDNRKALGANIRTMPSRFSGIRQDGANNFDLSLIKNARLKEGLRFQFRAEAINALNHPQFNAPNTNPASTAFGAVTTEYAWPRVVQFGVKVVF